MEVIIPVSAVAMIILGMFTKFYPPGKINAWYGYRTGLSKKSQEHWDFAQSLSALMSYWMVLSMMEIAMPVYVELAILIVASIIPIILTQQALKKL